MKIGVMMHVTDSTVTPAVFAVEAEQRGFESVFVTEHTHIPVRPFIAWRGGEAMPEFYKHLHDPIVALATARRSRRQSSSVRACLCSVNANLWPRRNNSRRLMS